MELEQTYDLLSVSIVSPHLLSPYSKQQYFIEDKKASGLTYNNNKLRY